MWYVTLLEPLILKVHKDDQQKAKLFLNEILEQIKYLTVDPIPAGLCLNLICTMYSYYDDLENQSVKLMEFTRDVFGLSIVYSKNFFDDAIGIFNFMLSSDMLKSLNYHNAEHESFLLERDTLIKLNYSMRTDFDYFLTIINQNQFKHLKNSIEKDFLYLLPLDDGKIFTEFLKKLKINPPALQPLAPAVAQQDRRHPQFIATKTFWEKRIQESGEQNTVSACTFN